MKKLLENRIVWIVLVILLEVVVSLALFNAFAERFAWVDTVLRIIGLFIVLNIVRRSRHLSADLIWVIAIMIAPAFGSALYLFIAADLFAGRTYRAIAEETRRATNYAEQDQAVMQEIAETAPAALGQYRYLSETAGYPVYRNTGFTYFPLGDVGYPYMLRDLEQARRFIFLEYFIIEPGEMWDGILAILERKAAEGVEVRVLYDDIGSVSTLPADYAARLEEKGIKCSPFNKVSPIANVVLNHRDHRKILVIDGKVAYGGGVNLADEYINKIEKHGHWKDNVTRVTGEAVWSSTRMFLTNWNALRHEDADYNVWRAQPVLGEPDGFIAPYGETPLDDENVAQNVYLNILNQATRYVYIMTPYLIIDTDMQNALILAAQRGVDVRLITPGVPDKKIVWDITRSYYATLIAGGVKVYEYEPGFVHSKVFVADDRVATVGTVNLDYRSLYLHFENGLLIWNSKQVAAVARDAAATLEQCRRMTADSVRSNAVKEFGISVLRIFAALL